ncbi:MAG TPA: dihydropteroate synthase [Acidobacteriota bacterium]|jgi:dihydropteroate synthase
MRKTYFVRTRGRVMTLGKRTWIMGIINATPDSFYPKSRASDVESALELAQRMISEGADMLDVGGESTRPGSDPVPQDEELERVLPVVAAIRKLSDVFISVDTYKSRVAGAALQAGADLINDISGFHWDLEMAATVAQLDAAAIVMHTRGTPKTMQSLTPSVDIFAEVESHLRGSLLEASRAGLSHDKIIIDPGIGFGKSLADNLRILRNLDYFQGLDCPVLVGPSRKSFIGKILDQDVHGRLWGTAAAVTCSILAGAHIVRVHDVAEMKEVAKMGDAFAESEISEISGQTTHFPISKLGNG